ncbi:MAG: Fic family protein [Bacilli bacterium]|nr:Fic family protein [Bacilli bacterium]
MSKLRNNSSKYCYEDGVLINNFDIHDVKKLNALSRDITTYKISQVFCDNTVVKNFFTVSDYLNLHKFLFADIFPFAGDIRDESIYKSNKPCYDGVTVFAMPYAIRISLEENLKKMRQNGGKIKTREGLLRYLAYYYGEINIIHPFREGNGRTLRTYMKLLVDYICPYLPEEVRNLEIDYSLWDSSDRENLLRATIKGAVEDNYLDIERCFDKVLVEKELTKFKGR